MVVEHQAHSAPGNNSCSVPKMVSVAGFVSLLFQSCPGWPEWKTHTWVRVSLNLVSVLLTVRAGSWTDGLWPCGAWLALTWEGFFKIQKRWLWVDRFSNAIPDCTFGTVGALWWFKYLPWDGTGMSLSTGSQNLHNEENLTVYDTWSWSNTCWFFIHFSWGFSEVLAIGCQVWVP